MRDDLILKHLLEKLDSFDNKLEEVRLDQKEIKLDLNYHIRRTDLLEEKVEEQGKLLSVMSAPFRLVMWLLKTIKILK